MVGRRYIVSPLCQTIFFILLLSGFLFCFVLSETPGQRTPGPLSAMKLGNAIIYLQWVCAGVTLLMATNGQIEKITMDDLNQCGFGMGPPNIAVNSVWTPN